MTTEARRALNTVRACLEIDAYALTVHFSMRMTQRGFFWPDVAAVIDDPTDVHSHGIDPLGRQKWIVAGEAADGFEIEIVCAIETDEGDEQTVFITLYWQD